MISFDVVFNVNVIKRLRKRNSEFTDVVKVCAVETMLDGCDSSLFNTK